ncbi:unnamed protein product [Ectocarpus sp. CCAP 1310/34]|nr:unnamed protein product [Ectocarpus sp. CCAP 1310/34]
MEALGCGWAPGNGAWKRAAALGNIEVLNLFLDWSNDACDLGEWGEWGDGVFAAAVEAGHTDVLKLLIAAGCNKDQMGLKALEVAVESENLEWSDTQAETFEWMMEAWMETRGGEGPDVFIQEADGACTLAADKVFKGAKKLRCLWHLWKNVKEKLGSILGKDFAAFTNDFQKMGGRLSETGFEESFEELCINFAKAENYLRHLYKDRHRWAAAFSVLTFSVSSFTSSRVEGINRVMKKVCGAMTSLQGVFEFFEGAIEKQEDRALLRTARLALPAVAMAGVDDVWFGDKFMALIRFGLGMWPFRYMTMEMEAAAIFCGGGGAVLEGDERFEAPSKLEFLGELIVGVETVAAVMESRYGRVMRYIVCSMQDGSHICSCRTLQELGLCCRHFWQAMRLSPKFKFHVGILNRHWLTEQGLRELEAWPPECKQWMVALVNSDASKDDQVRPPTAMVGDTWQAIPENATIETRLQRVAQTGQSSQDRRLLFVEMLKKTTCRELWGAACSP